MKKIIINACAVTLHYRIDDYQQKLVDLGKLILIGSKLKKGFQLIQKKGQNINIMFQYLYG
jgi:hypothetical protein